MGTCHHCPTCPPPPPPPHALPRRGGAERACRRWRQLALQLPCTLHIDLCELHELGFEGDPEGALAAIQRVLPGLAARRVTEMAVSGCTAACAAPLPGLLARTFFPHLLK